MDRFFYVCDGEVPTCGKANCMWNGNGECAHTTDESHARYPEPRVFADFAKNGSIFIERIREEDAG